MGSRIGWQLYCTLCGMPHPVVLYESTYKTYSAPKNCVPPVLDLIFAKVSLISQRGDRLREDAP